MGLIRNRPWVATQVWNLYTCPTIEMQKKKKKIKKIEDGCDSQESGLKRTHFQLGKAFLFFSLFHFKFSPA